MSSLGDDLARAIGDWDAVRQAEEELFGRPERLDEGEFIACDAELREKMEDAFRKQNRAYTYTDHRVPPADWPSALPKPPVPMHAVSGPEGFMEDLEHLKNALFELNSHVQDFAGLCSILPATGAAGNIRADVAGLLTEMEALRGHLNSYVSAMGMTKPPEGQ